MYYSLATRKEAEWCLKVDVYWLKQHGYFNSNKHGGIKWSAGDQITVVSHMSKNASQIQLVYTVTSSETGEKEHFNYAANLVKTSCHFGGFRYWFICPLGRGDKPCGRRVGALYQGYRLFGCRHCYNLTYESCNRNRRGSFSAYANFLDNSEKIDELSSQIKRPYYAGKPTKKYRKLLALTYQHDDLAKLAIKSL